MNKRHEINPNVLIPAWKSLFWVVMTTLLSLRIDLNFQNGSLTGHAHFSPCIVKGQPWSLE